MRSNDEIPSSPHATASPSMMQDRKLNRDTASTTNEKRQVRSFPGRLYSLTLWPFLRAMTLKPSSLISCSHNSPEGGWGADIGRRQGAIKPAGRAGGRNNIDG
jgi:hypothetical protein